MGQQEADGGGAVVDGGPVQGAAAVLRGALIEGFDISTVFERGGQGGRVTGDGSVPEPRLGVLGKAWRRYYER